MFADCVSPTWSVQLERLTRPIRRVLDIVLGLELRSASLGDMRRDGAPRNSRQL